MKRTHVHSANPILSSADVLRSHLHHGATGTCSHTAQACDCFRAAAFLSVDSIYYLEPQLIAELCEKSLANTFVAVCHEFDHAFGAFAEGEATYQLLGTTEVTMSVRGNSKAYRHSNLAWMRQNACPVQGKDGSVKTLAWTKIDTYANHSTFLFTVTDVVVPVDLPMSTDLTSCLQSTSYYGEVPISGALSESGKVAVAGDILSLPGTKLYSWGGSIIVYQSTWNLTMCCPKGAVAMIEAWSMGRARTPDNFRLALAYARGVMKKYNIPEELLAPAMFAATTLGFVRNVAFETSVLHGVISPLLPTIAAHKDALDHKFKIVWTWKRACAAIIAAGALTGGVLATAGALAGPAAAIYTGGAIAAAAFGGVTGMWAKHVLTNHPTPPTPGSLAFPEYYANRASTMPRTTVKHLGAGIRLPATDPKTTVEEALNPDKLDPSAKITIVDSTENRERDGQGPLQPGGIVSAGSIPVVPSNSAASAIIAMCERILKKGPWGRGEVDKEFFVLFENWVMKNLGDMGLGPKTVKAVPFKEWNQHYPAAQQAMHLRALHSMGVGDFNERLVNERGMFTKIESLAKSTPEGDPKVAPRGIQSGTPVHNVATGPFCKAFSKRLAEVWSIDGHPLGPKYTSGASAEQIGAMFKQACDGLEGRLGIIEGDFARFDSTIHRLFLLLEARIYSHVGCTEQAHAAFIACIKTVGRDKFGTRYEVDGGRHSGDHNTSCGNSLLQGLAILFCCAFYDASQTGILLSYKDIIAKYEITLPVLGDDNLVIGERTFIDALPLKGLLLKLGLELEPKKHIGPNAKYLASFCSSRFWPVEGGKVVLGPGIGRGIAKSGWYVNPPAGVDIRKLVRSDSIGRMQDNSFIPFLRHMWARNHALTKGAGVYMTREMRRSHLNNAHVAQTYQPCDDTYRMLEAVYGLTREHEAEYERMIGQVKSLPCIVDYAPLMGVTGAMAVDGVAPSDGEIYQDDAAVEDTPAMSDEAFIAAVANLSAPSQDWTPKVLRKQASPTRQTMDDEAKSFHVEDDESSVELMPFLNPFDN